MPHLRGLIELRVLILIEIGLVFSLSEYKIEKNDCISSEMSKNRE